MRRYLYECAQCEVRGVKLWRQFQTFADQIELLCKLCAIIDQEKTIDRQEQEYIASLKKHGAPIEPPPESDQIGNLIPAVPDILPSPRNWILHKDATFWGYSSVPRGGRMWWHTLPDWRSK